MRVARYAAFLTLFCSVALIPDTATGVPSEDCLLCHEDPSIVDSNGLSMTVKPDVYRQSVHGESGIECVDCHIDLSGVEDFPHDSPLEKVDCSMCHYDEHEDYATSVHGEAYIRDDPFAPRCSTCHGAHGIRRVDNPMSSVFPLNLVDICLSCHTDTTITTERQLRAPEKIRAYENSVHMRALKKKGLSVSAACNSCHGAHTIQPADAPESRINRFNIPKTCGECHQGIYQTYVESVHGQDYLKRNVDVPVCTDCHGEHSIKSHTDPDSTVYPTHIAEICSNCHEDETLSKRYGFASQRLKTYLGTYHGIFSTLGDTTVANCASCHGYHDIRPSNDPRSSIHPDNIQKTCGKCHPKAGKNFAIGKVHVSETREIGLGAYVVEKFYTIFIIASISGFLVFIVVDLYARRRKTKRHG